MRPDLQERIQLWNLGKIDFITEKIVWGVKRATIPDASTIAALLQELHRGVGLQGMGQSLCGGGLDEIPLEAVEEREKERNKDGHVRSTVRLKQERELCSESHTYCKDVRPWLNLIAPAIACTPSSCSRLAVRLRHRHTVDTLTTLSTSHANLVQSWTMWQI